MNTQTILIAAAAFGAGYLLSNQMQKPAAGVGASWNCQKNPNGPGCKGGQLVPVHTIILPFVKPRAATNRMIAGWL